MTRAQRSAHQHRNESPGARRSVASGAAAITALVVLAACGSSGGGAAPATPQSGKSSPGSSQSSPGSSQSGPAVVETNPPGDIPDNQAFVPYTGAGFAVTVPEGWARSSAGSSVVFSDKYNSITITSAPAAQSPTPASVRAVDLPKVKASSKGYVPGTVTTVQRMAGPAVLATYHAYSAVNPVTGKVANEAVERYTFWRAGKSVTLTLAAPVGSDNVDPWRKVTDSFKWTK